MQFYEDNRWEEPEVVRFEEPVQLRQGQWIEWSCDFQNDSSRTVAQGTATTDEMCTFIGLYYPKNLDMQQCVDPDLGGPPLNGINLVDGSMDGAAFLECFDAAPRVFLGNGPDPDRYATLRCFTQTCGAVSPLTQPFLECMAAHPGMCGDLREEIAGTTCE